MAMPLHNEQLFTKYAFARLRDIENSQQRAQLATMEKEAKWGRLAKWVLGLTGAGTAGYVGTKAYQQYDKNKDRFRMEDTTNWEKPTDFWNNPPTGNPAISTFNQPATPAPDWLFNNKADPVAESRRTLASPGSYNPEWIKRWFGGQSERPVDPAISTFNSPGTSPQRTFFRVPSGVTKVPSDWRLESEGTAYGMPIRHYSAPAPAPAQAPASASLMQKGASFDKNAGLFDTLLRMGKTTARGVGADVSTGVTGNWGLGGLLKGVGRMLGAESDTVLRQGLNNSSFVRRGSTVGGKTMNTLEDMGEFMKNQNKTLEEAAGKAGKIFDETAEAWNQTRRYLDPSEMKHLNPGMLQRAGQRLAHWGQKLTDMSDAGQAAYRRSLNANFGARSIGNQVLRKGIGFTSIAAPMGYVIGSEMSEPGTWWAAPGKLYGKAFEYGSIPGLLGTAAGGIGSMVEDTARTATIEGARMGSQITAGELANVGRKAYLAGLIDPDKLSYMVADRANRTIDAQLAAQNEAIDRVSNS